MVKPDKAADFSREIINAAPAKSTDNHHNQPEAVADPSTDPSPVVPVEVKNVVRGPQRAGQNLRNHPLHSQKFKNKHRGNSNIDVSVASAQLITPNPEIPCTPGLCLVYVRETFGIGPKYPSAAAGWHASKYKHEDQNFPADTWVPVWFSLSDEPAGHVALRQPDGSIWSSSSPTATDPVHHASLEDIDQYYGGRLTYLGWTEDIEDVRILNGVT